jgi:hypothetical protein
LLLAWKVWQRMSSSFRRCEILLPLQFNNGQAVPDELVGETLFGPAAQGCA